MRIIILKFEAVVKNYNALEVLKDVSFEVSPQEIVCIVGPSGCGKSTILNLISSLIKPDGGKIEGTKRKIGYVFQEDRLLPWRSLYHNIKLVNPKASKERIYNMIRDMGLEGFENHYPEQLSGGMRQRGSIARAFNYECELLLMDEAFKSLDYDLRMNMIRHLIKLWYSIQNAIVFVTHEIDEALLLGHKIIVLSSRPTGILNTFCIDTPQHKRRLQDEELVSIRSEIIGLLTKSNKKGF